MPKLSQFRLVSIGHPNARMQDVTLNFRTPSGEATDSTLWLRNGGGKSSILNLFFAILRTGRRDFLGGKADSKQRKLEDYILTNDRSAVAAEWILDFNQGELDLQNANDRFITGVYYERHSGKEGLRRLFFCTRVDESCPETCLATLPFDDESEDGGKRRRTLASFAQYWKEMRDKYPHLQAFCTEVQSDWKERLQAAGLDPGLFSYQLRMNMREGGADELFRFNSAEDFVDFLLELTIDASKSDSISENLSTFREQLRLRKHELLPDLEFSTGLIERLGPLVELNEKRRTSLENAKKLGHMYAQIIRVIKQNTKNYLEQSEKFEVTNEKLREELRATQNRAYRDKGIASALSNKIALKELAEAQRNLDDCRENLYEAKREEILWRALTPLRESDLSSKASEEYRSQFSAKKGEKAPIVEQLKEVADQYYAALKFEARRLRELQSELRKKFDENEASIDAKLEEAKDREMKCAALEAEIRSHSLNIRKQRELRLKLEESGDLLANEDSESALRRLAEKRSESEKALNRLEIAAERDEILLEETDLSIQSLVKQVAEQNATVANLTQQLKKAEEEKAILEKNNVLLQALEVESLDLDDLPEDAGAILMRRNADFQEKASRLRMQRVSFERARIHLQEHGLMPPLPEVSELLEKLGSSVSAKSGWAFLCDNYKGTNEEKDAVVRRVPQLLQGIIVASKDLERCKKLLSSCPLPESPITIACPEAFEDTELSGNAFVFGPKNAAWYDKGSAAKSLEALESSADDLDAQLAEVEKQLAESNEITVKYRHFRSRFPKGWFAAQYLQIKQLTMAAEDLASELEMKRDEKRRIASKKSDDEKKAAKLRDELSSAMAAVRRVNQFKEDLEQNATFWQQEIEKIHASKDGLFKEAVKIKEECATEREDNKKLLPQIQSVAENAKLSETKLSQIKYTSSPEACEGPVDEYRKRYERLCEQAEREIGDDELLRLAEREADQSKKYLKEAQRTIKNSDVTLDEVRQLLSTVSGQNEIDEKSELASEKLEVSQRNEKNAELQVNRLKIQCEQSEKEWLRNGKPTLPDELKDCDDPDVVAHYEQRSFAAFNEVEKFNKEIAENEKRKHEKKRDAESLQKDLQRLSSIQRVHTNLIGEDSAEEASADGEDIKAVEIPEKITELERELESHKANFDSLDDKRKSAVAHIRRWLDDPKYAGLSNKLAAQFRSQDPESLENSAKTYRESLTVRIREIGNTLTDIEKHRNLLSKLVLNAAEEGLRQLKLADRSSQIPLEVNNVGGSQFLRITTHEPISAGERLELITQLVDAIVDEDTVPTGVALVQRSVRQLARPFRVRVMNPDPASPQRYININETSRFSGGEQLTCAILLYCTLANVRARSRGLNRQPTGVLILDNPIGRASRTMFIDMQRQFASAMGIQLIYTTAVNDLEALSVLPNIIRLRNERIDRNRGHRLLELDTITGTLEAIQVGKFENTNPYDDNDVVAELVTEADNA